MPHPLSGHQERRADSRNRPGRHRSACRPAGFPADWGEGHFIGVVRVLDRVCQTAGLADINLAKLRSNSMTFLSGRRAVAWHPLLNRLFDEPERVGVLDQCAIITVPVNRVGFFSVGGGSGAPPVGCPPVSGGLSPGPSGPPAGPGCTDPGRCASATSGLTMTLSLSMTIAALTARSIASPRYVPDFSSQRSA